MTPIAYKTRTPAIAVQKLIDKRIEFTMTLGYGSAGEDLAVRIYGDKTLKDAIPEAKYLGYLRWWVVYPLEGK